MKFETQVSRVFYEWRINVDIIFRNCYLRYYENDALILSRPGLLMVWMPGGCIERFSFKPLNE